MGARPSPAIVLACVALCFAVAGSAVAGTAAVSEKITKRSVKKIAKAQAEKRITKRASGLSVAHAATADNATNATNAASATNLAASEPYHVVGASGEPPLGNGGENDCRWGSGSTGVPGINPVSFYKDRLGIVRFAGILTLQDGPGGDGACGPADSVEDFTAFTLPPAYRPPNLEFQATTDSSVPVIVFIGADQDVTIGTTTIPAGAVIPTATTPPGAFELDGEIEFRAAGTGGGAGFSTADTSVSASAAPAIFKRALKSLGG
jgi:hypothetical protein